MSRLSGLKRFAGLWVLLGCMVALAASSLLRYGSGGSLEYYDSYTESWLPARVNGSVIEYLSGPDYDPMWFNTGLTPADLPDSGSGSGSNSYGDLPGEYRSILNLINSRRDATSTLGTVNDFMATYYDYLYCFGDPCCAMALTCCDFGCLNSRPQNQEGGQVSPWDLRLGLSGTYRQTDLELFELIGGDAEDHRTYSGEVFGALIRDRMAVVFGLGYDRYEGDGLADLGDGYRLGLKVAPMYRLLSQKADGVDLSLITVVGLNRVWFDSALMDPGEVDHLTAGAGLGLGRGTPIGNLNLTALYQPTWNLNGDKELSGSTRLDTYGVGSMFTVGLAPDLSTFVSANWLYTADLVPEIDRDYVDGTVGLLFKRGSWQVSASYGQFFWNDDYKEWHASLDATKTF